MFHPAQACTSAAHALHASVSMACSCSARPNMHVLRHALSRPRAWSPHACWLPEPPTACKQAIKQPRRVYKTKSVIVIDYQFLIVIRTSDWRASGYVTPKVPECVPWRASGCSQGSRMCARAGVGGRSWCWLNIVPSLRTTKQGE